MEYNEKIYCCERCGFLFRRIGGATECPRCEDRHIRFATPEEQEKLLHLLKEIVGPAEMNAMCKKA